MISPTKTITRITFTLFLISFAFLYPNSGFAIDNYQNEGSGHKHPITHNNQYYIVPSDCQNGDNVGKVYELWTDRKFNDRGGNPYVFEIVGGNTESAFAIERNTGELLVSNAGGIKGDMTLSVKVSIGNDSQLSTVHIKRVNSSDIVYIDSQFSGTGSGSRAAPFKSFKGSGHGNGKPGKYYLYRRGRTYNNDILLIYNAESASRITIGSWGSGARPLLDGQNNKNSAIQLGSVYSSATGLDKTAFNVDVMDLEFTKYQSRTIVLTRRGKNFNFRRLKLGNTTAENGLIWLATQLNPGELYPSNIHGSDIEIHDFGPDRGFKIERGGEASNPIVFENIKGYNGSVQTYVSATDNPYVTLRYLHVDHGSTGASGPNIRHGQHNIEWAYIKGASRGIFLWKSDNLHSGVRGGHIRDVIIDGTTSGDGIQFEKSAASSYGHENIEISRVEIRNAGRHGINIQQSTKNITLSYALIYGSGQNGVRVDGSTSGTKTHNSIIIDNKNTDFSAGGNTDVQNTIYQSKSGVFKEVKNTSESGYFENRQQKNYRPKADAPYLNKGSVLGYKVDLEGKAISGNPSLGAYESISASEPNLFPTIAITSPKGNDQFIQGDNISITANAAHSDGTIAKVDFYSGTTLLGTDTTSPYSFAWANPPTGSFALTAKATDNKGTAAVSTVVNITVVEKGNVAPTVSLTAPNANAKFIQGDNISITANAADSDGTIAKVDFYNGTTLLGTDTTSPYSFAWENLPVGSFALTAKATDNLGTATVSAAVNITVAAKTSRSPFGGTAATIPGTVEAENYDIGGQGVTYFDVDAGNNGKVYRSDDVDIEPAAEGGYNVGWMNLNEWLEYTVNITTAGAYNLDARVASLGAGGTFHIECDGIDVTGPLTIPSTGGWNTWTSVKKTGVNLPGGMHVLRFVFESEGVNGYLGNFNSMDFTKSNLAPTVSITAPTANSQFIQGDNISITANVSDSAGTIAKVDFYNGTTLLGTDTTSPYSYAWANLPVGSFPLTAKATDNNGTVTVSEVVNISAEEKRNDNPGKGAGAGLMEGLVAFYEMNTNSSGALRDSHGQNHGTSKLISHVTGFNDKGNKYDGESSISSVPHSNGLSLTTEFTLMADMFRHGNGQQYGSTIIGKTLSTQWSANQAYSLSITPDNKIRIRTNSPGLQDWVSTQTVPLGKWVRVIATYKSGEGYSLYFDSVVPEKSHIVSGSIHGSDSELTIGGASSQADAAKSRWFEGILDNVGIWNRKLSPEEITTLITNKITYPDFGGNEVYRVLMTSEIDEIPGEIPASSGSTEAEPGEKLVFFVGEEDDVVFDHWSIDSVKVSDQPFFELEMPKKDITLTQHFRTFVAPEINIVLPDQQSEFEALSEVHIELETKSNDAKIEKVELFNGEELLGKLTQDSTGFDWKNIPEGNHQLVARITDTNGKNYSSNPVLLKAIDYQSNDIPNVLLEYVIGPNPTTDYLNVIFKNLDGLYDFEFRIVSMNGIVEKTFTARPEESTVTLDVSDLKTGVYIIQLRSTDNILTSKKFIKK